MRSLRGIGLLGCLGAFGLVGVEGCQGGGHPATVSNDAGGTFDAMSGNDGASRGGDDTDSGGGGDDGSGGGPGDDGDADDGSATCGPDGTACSNGGSDGLCASMVCAPCNDPTDDSACTAAYGNASTPFLCLSGQCTPGDCRTNSDCVSNSAGELCGVSTPNVCGPCTADSQCAAVDSTTPVCDTSSGKCVAGTCTPSDAGNAPEKCSVNPSDICCTKVCEPGPGSGAVACCPDSTSTTYCTTKLGEAASCVGNVCTACQGVTDGDYSVDPVGGNDTTGTGDGTQAGCAFKTIARALQVIGTPAIATTITLLGPSTVSAGETFPIHLPKDVSISTSGGKVTVNVPAKSTGFILATTGSGIHGGVGAALTISGGVHVADYGILAETGSLASTKIDNVTVTEFLRAGILVQNAGVLSIGEGVTSSNNGTSATGGDGLHVTGTGKAIIAVASGSTTTAFSHNTADGILVDGSGVVTLTGSVTSATAGTGTITANGNTVAGLLIAQTPGTPPQNVIDGLVAFGTTGGNGLRLVAGSNVEVRNSAPLGNRDNGVLVISGASMTPGSNDISKIDLGNTETMGQNTLQEPLGAAGANGGVGICLAVVASTGTLLATGNTFGTTDCATTAAKLSFNKTACTNLSSCAGGTCDLGATTAGNTFTVTKCSP